MNFILRVLATAAAFWVAAWLLPGVNVSGDSTLDTIWVLVIVSVIFGLVNAVVKPLFSALSSCLIVITFGLFLFVINALMLMLTSWICAKLDIGFSVDGFWWALAGSIVISLISGLISGVLGAKRGERRS